MKPLSVLGHLKLHHLHRNLRDSIKNLDELSKHVADHHHKEAKEHLNKAKIKFLGEPNKHNKEWVKQHVKAASWAKDKV